MPPPPILLTGATGFLGAHLARRLVAGGRRVHALARAGSDRGRLADLPLVWHPGDLRDGASLERTCSALAGTGFEVIHAAALISYRRRDRALQEDCNAGGTRRLLAACRRHGAGRVVHVSSVVAVGHAPRGGPALDEDWPFNGGELRCDYVDTKRAAEELALAAAREPDGLDLSVVNPGAVFGPDSARANTTAFVREVARGATGPFAPPGSLAVVGVEDVAAGTVAALERGRRGRRYLLTESNLSLRELMELTARLLGRRPVRWTLAPALWRAAVAPLRVWDRLRPLERATPQALALLGVHFRFDSSRARRELDWRPEPFEGVLERTVGWMRAEGLL